LTAQGSSDLFARAAQAFSFLAIATSMIGISMAMKGALYDVWGEWKILRRSVEVLIVLPIVPAIFKPQLFFTILGLAGGIFGNLIAGILPLTPFLGAKRFRVGYLLLWLTFIGIFTIECINLL
jgi:amino acid permease